MAPPQGRSTDGSTAAVRAAPTREACDDGKEGTKAITDGLKSRPCDPSSGAACVGQATTPLQQRDPTHGATSPLRTAGSRRDRRDAQEGQRA